MKISDGLSRSNNRVKYLNSKRRELHKFAIGRVVRFMLQEGGYGVGEIIEHSEKNKHAYKIRTTTGEFWIMRAEIC